MNEISSETSLSQESAEAEFDRWAECMDLLFVPSAMTEEEQRDFETQKARIVRAIKRGRLAIDDDGLATYTPAHPNSTYKEPLTFHERDGATLHATNGQKKSESAKSVNALLGNLCKVHPGTFAKLHGEDIKVCETLLIFLMA